MMPRTLLPAERINQIVRMLPYNGTLVWNPRPTAMPIIRQYDRIHSNHSHEILSEYEYSHTALIGLLYSLSNYQEAVEEHRKSQDPAFYLKRQLSWLDKKYEETQWVGYQESIDTISQYLRNYSGRWLNKSQQIDFARDILPLLSKYPVPIPEIKSVCLAYEKNHEKLPRKKKLNSIFSKLGLPYVIESKQVLSKNRQTHWIIYTK